MSGGENDQGVWKNSFNEDIQEQQMADDSHAWRSVTGLLLAIIAVGVSLALFTAYVCINVL
jgi:hypothetical protein